MAELNIAIRVILVAAVFIAFVASLILLVRFARRGGKDVQTVGAMLMLFGWGNLRDPGSNTVAEAQDGRIRKGNESGEPPD